MIERLSPFEMRALPQIYQEVLLLKLSLTPLFLFFLGV